ncbi:hypothetical protein MKZ38_008264 [Zalerion maritima]|uniref:CBM1 domain-containing protein n=1 Tax=Zalerion maritima TaxID=339359 RepID=A0AAD5RU95_9PEZI|nr:hypothetical protein MKZ38_008264 [Zalerion maritima]
MSRITSTLLLAGAASAEVASWGQCGGTGYSGETDCIDGTYCTTWNPYYAQCVPGTSAAGDTPTSTSTSMTAEETTDEPTSTEEPGSSTSTSSSSTATAEAGTSYFISFGDSYSQTGFDYTSTKASSSNPLGNPDLPGWTASGGLNWVGFMVTEFNTSLRLSYNFAYGGATVDADLVEPYTDTVLSMIDQVDQFSAELASHPDYAPWTAENTVVGVWMGVNDIGNSYWLDDEDALIEEVVAKYFEELQIVYDAGARQFVLLGVPPIYETPLMLEQDDWSRTTEAAVIETFNGLIDTYLASFQEDNAGVVATVVDTANPFYEAIDNPAEYGAPDATCYNEDGVSCLWFNNYHPGVAINELVAAAVQDAMDAAGMTG